MIKHELLESFCHKGHRIFNPHHTVTELASLRPPEKYVPEHIDIPQAVLDGYDVA
jgi:hypothetical protein